MLLDKWHGGENRYDKVIFIYIIYHMYDVQENPTKFRWSGKNFQGSDVSVIIGNRTSNETLGGPYVTPLSCLSLGTIERKTKESDRWRSNYQLCYGYNLR